MKNMAHDSLLAQAIHAHGGAERWEQIQNICLDVRVGGKILALKFRSPRALTLQCTISTRRVHIAFSPFPHVGSRGTFDGESLQIESNEGAVVRARKVTRTAEGAIVRRTIWDELDLLYFLGYALWNYANTPFLFRWPGFEFRETGPWQERDGEVWHRLCVTYPAGFPTHSREQTFYFDSNGFLRRLDYTADVFGSSARGAHYCEGHQKFHGLVFPTHRVVFVRLGSGHPLRLFSVMEGWIDGVKIASC
jgi:hypothetical protein